MPTHETHQLYLWLVLLTTFGVCYMQFI